MFDRQAMRDAVYAARLTDKDLAARMGYHPVHVNAVLNGRAAVTRKFAVRLATVLGVPVESFEAPAEAAATGLEAAS